jgi:hypothetical protein
MRKHFNLPGKDPKLPFSDAVLVGDTLYLSGRLGLKPGTREVPATAEEEARNILDQFKQVLAAAGHDDGRPRERAGVLLGRQPLRHLEQRVPDLLHEGAAGAGLPGVGEACCSARASRCRRSRSSGNEQGGAASRPP